MSYKCLIVCLLLIMIVIINADGNRKLSRKVILMLHYILTGPLFILLLLWNTLTRTSANRYSSSHLESLFFLGKRRPKICCTPLPWACMHGESVVRLGSHYLLPGRSKRATAGLDLSQARKQQACGSSSEMSHRSCGQLET